MVNPIGCTRWISIVPSGAVSLGSPTTSIAPSARVYTSADPSVGLICQHFAVTTRASGHYWDRAQAALGKKPADEQVFQPALRHLADRVASRLRAKSRPGRTVTVRVRFANLHSVTRSVTLDVPISATATLAEIVTTLADHPEGKAISLLAISVSHLEKHWKVLSLSETYALKYWWCSPPRTGIASGRPTVWTARGTGASLCSDRCVRASL